MLSRMSSKTGERENKFLAPPIEPCVQVSYTTLQLIFQLLLSKSLLIITAIICLAFLFHLASVHVIVNVHIQISHHFIYNKCICERSGYI